MNGVLLCSRFSYEPCHLGYCGPSKADKVLEHAIESKSYSKARAELEKFEGLYHYLWLIGGRNGLDPFDEKVVEAYWLGNSLLEKVTVDDIKWLINEKFSVFLTPSVAKKLADAVPSGVTAHHSFHVFHILSMRSLTGRAPQTFETVSKCYVNPAEVVGVADEKLSVKGKQLKEDGSFVDVTWPVTIAPWLGKVSVGDFVAVHWDMACMQLEKSKATELDKLNREQAIRLISL